MQLQISITYIYINIIIFLLCIVTVEILRKMTKLLIKCCCLNGFISYRSIYSVTEPETQTPLSFTCNVMQGKHQAIFIGTTM